MDDRRRATAVADSGGVDVCLGGKLTGGFCAFTRRTVGRSAAIVGIDTQAK
jgi:hypothetical protein